MQTEMPAIVLASASPRRKELLEQIGIEAICHPVDIDESPLAGESPSELVHRLALEKARCCKSRLARLHLDTQAPQTPVHYILGADTIIDLDGQALGKPCNKEAALTMLQALSEREHHVHTGVAIVSIERDLIETALVTTAVEFGRVSQSDALNYWESGEPAGKAGSYAIQGCGARFVSKLSGSYSNVVGLPLYETVALLRTIKGQDVSN
ncbi:MAG: nucleoside triphosphate pyrophosphatase [Granulosicoccus sp.]